MSPDELTEIGRRLKTVRKSLRYSQRAFAKELGMSHSYLSEIESGKANPKTDFFLKLSKRFAVNTEYLYHGSGEMYSAAGVQGEIENRDFDFDSELRTVDQLVSLMENSSLFKNTVMGFASKFLLDNEGIIKKSISKSKKVRDKK